MKPCKLAMAVVSCARYHSIRGKTKTISNILRPRSNPEKAILVQDSKKPSISTKSRRRPSDENYLEGKLSKSPNMIDPDHVSGFIFGPICGESN
jgi:hypothetical protein